MWWALGISGRVVAAEATQFVALSQPTTPYLHLWRSLLHVTGSIPFFLALSHVAAATAGEATGGQGARRRKSEGTVVFYGASSVCPRPTHVCTEHGIQVVSWRTDICCTNDAFTAPLIARL